MDWLAIAEVALRATEPRMPIVDVARCLATRHPATGCDACVGVCPRGAIPRDSRPQIDLSACNGCGACAAVCPSGALESAAHVEAHGRWLYAITTAGATAASDASLTNAVPVVAGTAAGSAATVRCERASSTARRDTDLVLPCLGALRPADLVTAAIAGAAHVTVVRGACGGCDDRQAAVGIDQVVRVAQAALDALDVGAHTIEINEAGSAPASRTPARVISRRELFELPRRWSRRATVELVRETESRPTALARRGPDPVWRSRLDAALNSVASASVGGVLPMELGVASVTVGDNCDGCGLCVLGCPLGAIDMVGRSVVSTCRSCPGCGLCREVCPAGAITLVPTTIARNAGPTGDAARSGAPLMAQERREPAGSLVSAEHLANRAADADRQMRSEVANRLLRNAGQHP